MENSDIVDRNMEKSCLSSVGVNVNVVEVAVHGDEGIVCRNGFVFFVVIVCEGCVDREEGQMSVCIVERGVLHGINVEASSSGVGIKGGARESDIWLMWNTVRCNLNQL